jgi:hypothetical protein
MFAATLLAHFSLAYEFAFGPNAHHSRTAYWHIEWRFENVITYISDEQKWVDNVTIGANVIMVLLVVGISAALDDLVRRRK